MLRDVFEFFSRFFWIGALGLGGIALVVFLARLSKNKVPATAGVVNAVGNATGLSI